MRVTIRLDDELHRRARQEADRRGVTLSALAEEGLRFVLRPRVLLPACSEGGGVFPGVDLNNSAVLLDHMEDEGPGR